MGTARRVPQTRAMAGDELSVDDAVAALRRYGRWPLVRDAYVRFRYADGFSNSRALALQMVLTVIPLAIAFVGLSTALHGDRIGRVAELAIQRLAAGPSQQVVEDALERSRRHNGEGTQFALWFGLVFAWLNLTTAMAQIERGANRIYGIERDRPFVQKYTRGLVMSVTAGLPLGLAALVIVAGADLGSAVVSVYHLGGGTSLAVWNIARWPVGLLLALAAASVIFRRSPRREQPGYTWLTFGAAVYLGLWGALTLLLALYVRLSGSFDTVYGPLSAFMSLLVWTYLTSIALYLGLAFAAQLEAARAKRPAPVQPDPGA
ncbi:YihY/virulence factor BrkB family protein [Streptomyces sp. V4-01]|uniref:YihY/virulence factor BrkB family protein n=1 Tax=Actinacidiphila polyblastidii TaxID=3110430 RepID=A0ABU7PG78_9ACTN|nr:YihY/virulence factor BrkB family protein [Streptomyces sp. V4-01]